MLLPLVACLGAVPSSHATDYIGAGQISRRDVEISGVTRAFYLYLPPDFSGPTAVVFALIGGGGTVEMMRASGNELLADRTGYALVYPEPHKGMWRIGDDRDAGAGSLGSDEEAELAFFDAMFDSLIEEKVADPERIYVAGGSRGGLMALRLACERAQRIRAIAPSRIGMLEPWKSSCKPSRPISVQLTAGTEDPFIPFEGGGYQGKSEAAVRFLSFDDTLRFWVERNGCIEKARTGRLYDIDPDDRTKASETRWSRCRQATQVAGIRVDGMGHAPPGVRIPGELTRDIEKQLGRPFAELTGRTTHDFHGPSEDWHFFERVARNLGVGGHGQGLLPVGDGLHVMTLPDGRALSWTEYGANDGLPVFYFHGGGSSHIEAAVFDAEADSSGVRLIAPNRPGVGGSTLAPAQSTIDYSLDVAALADHLDISRFVVAGLSNGGMFTMAVAKALPERVLGAVPINATTPLFSDPQAMAVSPPSTRAMYERVRGAIEQVIEFALTTPQQERTDPASAMPVTAEPDIVASFGRNRDVVSREAFRRELELASSPWGFDHVHVRVPVVMYSGVDDPGFAYAKVWAARLPGGQLKTFPGGHIGLLAPTARRDIMHTFAALSSGTVKR